MEECGNILDLEEGYESIDNENGYVVNRNINENETNY